MKIAKRDVVLIIILIIGIVLAFSKYGHADSIICNDIIFTETSTIEGIPSERGIIFSGTIPVKEIKGFALGASIITHMGSGIYFNKITVCIEIEDEVNSVKNLRWFLRHSKDARMSLWKQQR